MTKKKEKKLLMTQEIVVVSSCVKKTCAFVVMGIGKKVVWARGGMGRGH